jgi:hypothetical protein
MTQQRKDSPKRKNPKQLRLTPANTKKAEELMLDYSAEKRVNFSFTDFANLALSRGFFSLQREIAFGDKLLEITDEQR